MTGPRKSCVAYKAEFDRLLGPEAPDRDELERITARFNDPADPLKVIIVTAKLLTGFDAPIL